MFACKISMIYTYIQMHCPYSRLHKMLTFYYTFKTELYGILYTQFPKHTNIDVK